MTLAEYLDVFRRYIVLILVSTFAVAAAAAIALSAPATKYEAQFAVALSPKATDPGNYGNLIDALDRRSIPSTFAQVITSPNARLEAAKKAGLKNDPPTVQAIVVSESNVIEATVTGTNFEDVKTYAAALLAASTGQFEKLYSVYTVSALRAPDQVTEQPRHVAIGLVLGALVGAFGAYVAALAIDANRRNRAPMELAAVIEQPATQPVISKPPAVAKEPAVPKQPSVPKKTGAAKQPAVPKQPAVGKSAVLKQSEAPEQDAGVKPDDEAGSPQKHHPDFRRQRRT